MMVHAKAKARNQLCLLILTTIFELFRILLLFLVLLEEKGKRPRWKSHFYTFFCCRTKHKNIWCDVGCKDIQYKDQAEVFNVKIIDQLLSILCRKKLVNLYRIEMVSDTPEQYKVSNSCRLSQGFSYDFYTIKPNIVDFKIEQQECISNSCLNIHTILALGLQNV
uniref:Uncharacterized protein n=1 Tax=Micrurus spixii TaxID=129469 RepID=A0A2D4NDM6_9SAUR